MTKFGVDVLIPSAEDRQIVHDIIYGELCLGNLNRDSKHKYLRIIDRLSKKEAEAVILGCTEIGLLVKQDETQARLFDTTAIHAEKAVEYALKETT